MRENAAADAVVATPPGGRWVRGRRTVGVAERAGMVKRKRRNAIGKERRVTMMYWSFWQADEAESQRLGESGRGGR